MKLEALEKHSHLSCSLSVAGPSQVSHQALGKRWGSTGSIRSTSSPKSNLQTQGTCQCTFLCIANAHFCLSKGSVLSSLSLLQTDTLPSSAWELRSSSTWELSSSSTWELLPSFQSIFGFCLKKWAPFTPQFSCSKVYYTDLWCFCTEVVFSRKL